MRLVMRLDDSFCNWFDHLSSKSECAFAVFRLARKISVENDKLAIGYVGLLRGV